MTLSRKDKFLKKLTVAFHSAVIKTKQQSQNHNTDITKAVMVVIAHQPKTSIHRL